MEEKALLQICKKRMNMVCKDGKPFKIYGDDFIIPCVNSPLNTSNTIVLGDKGIGKTKEYVIPNIENDAGCNYVIASTQGSKMAELIEDYSTKTISLPGCENTYYLNPMIYLKDRGDVEDLAKALLCVGKAYNSSKSLLPEIIAFKYLTLLLLMIRGLYANKKGFERPHKNYNLLSICKLNEMTFDELSAAIEYAKDVFPKDEMGIYWDVFKIVLYETGDSLDVFQEDLKNRLCFLWNDKYRGFFERDNLELDKLFNINMQAIVLNVSDKDERRNLYAVMIMEILDIMMKSQRFNPYTKFILDDFYLYGHQINNVGRFITRDSNSSVDIVVRSLEQLRFCFPCTWQILFGNMNIINMGTPSISDADFLAEISARNMLMEKGVFKGNVTKEDILKLRDNGEIVFLNGYGAYICTRYTSEEIHNSTTKVVGF